MKLLGTLILRPLRRDLLRTILTVLAVALGVAVVVAIDLAGAAATGSFQSSVEALAGRTDIEILANGGIDERWIGKLDGLPVNAKFTPLLQRQTFLRDIGSVTLYGADMLGGSPGGGVVISRALADRLGLKQGGTVNLLLAGGWQPFSIGGIADAPSAEFVAMDIAQMEKALGQYGKLDRIDVTVAPGEDFTRVERMIRETLPASYLIGKPGVRSEENQRMVRAFRWNLRVLSYISLVVGAFLIYNTIAMSVVRRRAEIGILRAIGAGRGTVFGLFLTEALLLGVGGAAAGVALGRVLAGMAVQFIALTVNALYATSRPAPVALTWTEAGLGLLIGAAVALASAFVPAREAMRVAPTEAMGRGAREHRARLRWRRGLGWGAAFAVAALAASQAPPLFGGFPAGGYLSAFLSVAAAALAAPAVVIAVNRATQAVTRRRLESLLAGRSLAGSLSRTSVVVGALATAIAMMASVGIMVGSFRETVLVWLDTQFRADLYVGPAGAAGVGEYPPLPAAVPAILRSTPGVAAVDLLRAAAFHYQGERATLGANDSAILIRYGRLRFLPGEDRNAILSSLPNRDRAIVSEPFANKHRIRAGDRLAIPIGEHNVTLTVAGIYYDYTSSQGWVLVDATTLLKYLPAQPATNAAVYLAPGAAEEQVRRAIQLRTAGHRVAIMPYSQIRRVSMMVFDRTFAITWALEAVAIVVAMLGAANSLLALVLDRRRELGLLRYLGASGGQIRGVILTEAAFLGALASLLGLALGFVLSLLLVFVINKQSFGWTIQFHAPGALLAGALALVWCVTVLAGIYPARVAARLNPIDVIHEE
jgi:putative ABC transport system permease protein